MDKKELYREIKTRFVAGREARGLSQGKTGEYLGKSQQAISMFENHPEMAPDFEHMVDLLECYQKNTPPDYGEDIVLLEEHLLKKYMGLPPNLQILVMNMLEVLSAK